MASLGYVLLVLAAFVHVLTAQTIMDIINQREELRELRSLMGGSTILSVLGKQGVSFTFFAPSNEGLRDLPPNTRASLQNQAEKDKILTYHVVPQDPVVNHPFRVADLQDRRVQTMAVDSPKLFFRTYSTAGKIAQYVNGARVITGDIQASNGVVHIISDLLYPVGSKKNALALIAHHAQRSEQGKQTRIFNEFLNDLKWQLNSPYQKLNSDLSYVTAFIPTDKALEKILDSQRRAELRNDLPALLKLVNRHIIFHEVTGGSQNMGVEAVWHSKLLNDFIDNNLASGATRYSSIPAAEGHIKPVRVGRELYVTNVCGMVKVADLPRRRRQREWEDGRDGTDGRDGRDGTDGRDDHRDYPDDYDYPETDDRNPERSTSMVLPDETVNNGVVHFVDGLLGYIYKDAIGLLDEDRSMSMFRDKVRMSSSVVDRLSVGANIQVAENKKYTIFAPSNTAFEMVERRSNIDLTQNQTLRDMVLNMHMLRGMISIADITNTTQKATLQNGVTATFVADRTGTYVIVNNIKAKIIQADTCVRNGIVHQIDNLLGVAYMNLLEKVQSDDRLLALSENIEKTPTFVENPSRDRALSAIMQERYGRRTLFAPTNFAFNRMSETVIGQRYMDRFNSYKLYRLLLDHMPKGEYFIRDTFTGEEQIGNDLYVSREGREYYVEFRNQYGKVRAKILERNLRQTNGVVHKIDAVLFIDTEEAFSVIGGAAIYTQSLVLLSLALLLQLVSR